MSSTLIEGELPPVLRRTEPPLVPEVPAIVARVAPRFVTRLSLLVRYDKRLHSSYPTWLNLVRTVGADLGQRFAEVVG
ncbi:hypothetical protein JMUB5695_04038 [Mycobacterium heckeshornense]|uniref:hypothetical protein n=1 Tax=Mycobacterium heckeshornense TaxID=110505 RepID=UPI001942E4CA|nr:hypothetical protein [Mycobacterium heckeshornense]BCQ10580.1 hypothetical protein JMUB5695_04038 [Mycobacterium heckeshornense]